jgi:hypothetical protein
MGWQEEYQKKLVTPEQAVSVIKDGDRVCFVQGNEPQALGLALAGRLGEVCDKISIFYEKRLQASIQSVMTLIEPLMITILGVVIGTIAIALLLPVFRVSSVIAH